MSTRIVLGREGVAREVLAATPLMAALAAPVTARAPWLTAVLNQQRSGPVGPRPAAVVVAAGPHGPPAAVGFLLLRRRALGTLVTILGTRTAPTPGGRPTARLLARDDEAATRLAAGIHEVLNGLHGPWTMRLTGLPLGDPTARELSARLPTGLIGNSRSTCLIDGLDVIGGVARSGDPAVLERWLPALLAREPDRRARRFLRAAARLHVAIGQVELAVVVEEGRLRAGLLTLVDGADRWPWWGFSDVGGLPTGAGTPLASLTAPARRWP
ncbi:MAG TPA: hypothetical protein VGD12_01320 [Blastococcus sp.]|jgi:hypothetical protein